jgi:hypothetical protein
MLSRSANLLAPHAWLEDKERSELSFAPNRHENLALGFSPGFNLGFNPISANLLCYDMSEPEFCVLWETLTIREQNVASLLKSGKDPMWAECSAGADEA